MDRKEERKETASLYKKNKYSTSNKSDKKQRKQWLALCALVRNTNKQERLKCIALLDSPGHAAHLFLPSQLAVQRSSTSQREQREEETQHEKQEKQRNKNRNNNINIINGSNSNYYNYNSNYYSKNSSNNKNQNNNKNKNKNNRSYSKKPASFSNVWHGLCDALFQKDSVAEKPGRETS